jgi:hypothetical protein
MTEKILLKHSIMDSSDGNEMELRKNDRYLCWLDRITSREYDYGRIIFYVTFRRDPISDFDFLIEDYSQISQTDPGIIQISDFDLPKKRLEDFVSEYFLEDEVKMLNNFLSKSERCQNRFGENRWSGLRSVKCNLPLVTKNNYKNAIPDSYHEIYYDEYLRPSPIVGHLTGDLRSEAPYLYDLPFMVGYTDEGTEEC